MGWRRTTLTEVARRAGVSRMTIYRAWTDMRDLLGDLLTREWAEVGDRHFAQEGNPRDVLVNALVQTTRAMRHNPLYQRILELDPEIVLPYAISRRGRVQEHLLEAVLPAVRAGQESGQIRADDPETIARALLMATQGFMLTIRVWLDETTTEEAVDTELVLLLDRMLRP